MHKNPASKDILVLEDDVVTRALVRAQLGSQNYNVTCVGSGHEALEWLSANEPRLVVLDLLLPGGMDGFQVCRWIRERYDAFSLPVLMLTALEDVIDDPTLSLEAGANALLTKPYHSSQLIDCVDHLLAPTFIPDAATNARHPKGFFLFMRERRASERWVSTVPRVIVADDEAYLRRIFARTLLRNGFDVREAEDGDALMDMLQADMPDLLLLDIHMPGEKSHRIIEYARSQPVPPAIMLISGHPEAVEDHRYQDVDIFLTKPVSTRDLSPLATRLLR